LDIDSCIHDGWLYFPESLLSNEYLYLLFKIIKNDLISLGNGSIFTNLKTDILKNFNIVMPDIYTLNKFQSLIIPFFKTMKNISRENQRLSALRDALLPELLSGKLNV
ncbi:MAG: restriction endonuclease subunit S, partial [Ruminococcus sp.]|nr:restriction endonuclease subunit S [Ruminococcus sp.]